MDILTCGHSSQGSWWEMPDAWHVERTLVSVISLWSQPKDVVDKWIAHPPFRAQLATENVKPHGLTQDIAALGADRMSHNIVITAANLQQ